MNEFRNKQYNLSIQKFPYTRSSIDHAVAYKLIDNVFLDQSTIMKDEKKNGLLTAAGTKYSLSSNRKKINGLV